MTLSVVTGASRGIGAALAARLPGEVIGSATGAGGATAPSADGRALVPLDLTDPDFGPLLAAVDDRPVDVLVCNAGIYEDRATALADYDAEIFARGFAVNATGAFLTVQALLPALRRAGGKVAIVSSQMGSSERAGGGSYIYKASKAAAINLARNLAHDLAAEGIAVGVYHPGWVRTDMGGPSAAISPEESAAGLLARIAALGPETTGVFETWDGRPHRY